MIPSLAFVLGTSSLLLSLEDQKFLENQPVDPDAALFIKSLSQENLQDTTVPSKKKCSFANPFQIDHPPILSPGSPAYSLSVFISFSVPKESWKELSFALEKLHGRFVLQGLPQNSFPELALKILELRNFGILAPIAIDPLAYEVQGVTAVPTLLLESSGKVDIVSGNIPVRTALKIIADEGSLKTVAQRLLQELDSPALEDRND